MAVQKLGGAAKANPAAKAAPAAEPVKEEKKAAVAIDLNNLAGSYKALEAAAKEKTSTGVKASDMIGTVKKLFDETGKDELLFSGVSAIVKASHGGKKLYNQLRSAILAKNSPYDLVTKEDGHAYVVKGKQAKPEETTQ